MPYSEPAGEYMLKVPPITEGHAGAGGGCPGGWHKRARIALLSNPKSTGNIAQLPRIREFCDSHPDLFHYEVEQAKQIGEAMRIIARVQPSVLVINGGDGTVQAALTELYNGAHFGDRPPPVAVLPSGKTNLIALDLGARGDPVETLERLIELARTDALGQYTVARELIALRRGGAEDHPIIGMFLGGAGLAETMLYCREKIYPLGLPNSVAHTLTAAAAMLKQVFRIRASFLPPDSQPLNVSLSEQGGSLSGRFSLLAVTTLEKLLLSTDMGVHRQGTLKLLAIEEHPKSVIGALFAKVVGKLGRSNVDGVHFKEADEITIEGESSQLILDGETIRAEPGRPIRLRTAEPLSFVKLAA
ncbi:MAG TPA: diacylglycerol kinase family protein [Sphingomicrobium sp.]|nr:diacylglycerol kinase family protein [Sphingomicrobium sp.]